MVEMISEKNKSPRLSASLQRSIIDSVFCVDMGFSKTEVNLRRLLAAAPNQQNQAKLIHYVATLREQLEQLASETTPECPQRISKAKVSDFSEKIEAFAARIADPPPCFSRSVEAICTIRIKESPRSVEVSPRSPTSPGLRRRFVRTDSLEAKGRTYETVKSTPSSPNKLDPLVQSHIEKHRKLQEDLTDEMVGLAKQLKENSIVMKQSLQDTERVKRTSFIVLCTALKLDKRKNDSRYQTSKDRFQ